MRQISSDGTRGGPSTTFARLCDGSGGWVICEVVISWDERLGRRLRGFHPETPRRSTMHAAYRRKTRRR